MKIYLTLFGILFAAALHAQTLPLSGILFDDDEPVPFQTIELYDFNQEQEPSEPILTVTTDENGQYFADLPIPMFFDLEYYTVMTPYCEDAEAEWGAEYNEFGEFASIIVNVICNGPQPGEVYIQAYPITEDNLTWSFTPWIMGEFVEMAWQIQDEPFLSENLVYTFETSGIFPVFLTVVFANGEILSVGYDVAAGDENAFNCKAAFFPVLDSLEAGSEVLYFENYSVGSNLAYLWEFGDGSTSTEAFPTHVFEEDFLGTEVCLTVTNEAGCVDVDCLTLVEELFAEYGFRSGSREAEGVQMIVLAPEFSVLSADDMLEVQDLKLYPNPVQEQLQIAFSANGSIPIEVRDLTGRLVLSHNSFQSGETLDFSALARGMYLVKIGEEVRKVVRE